MMSMEWVEVRGRTVEEAVKLGLEELGLESAEGAEIEVLQQPQRGFLGIGSQDALVRIKPRPKRRRRRRSRSSGEGAGSRAKKGEESKGGRSEKGRQPQERRGRGREKVAGESGRTRNEAGVRRQRAKSGSTGNGVAGTGESSAPAVSVDDQAAIVQGFLEGLLQAFGLEGEVATRVDEDIIYADVSGEQTEALVGTKGAILGAILELSRTMVHRQSQAGARLRLDIAGYNQRRREALGIYAGRLAAKVLEEGGEVMLEPMNAADRKVVHDAVAEIDGVRSFSEGEDPDRSVVISRADED